MAVVVGDRIVVEGQPGTVRFVGELRGVAGTIWYGVEWDDSARGKHDGSHNGARYFSTSHPASGSFIKPSKKIVVGRSFLYGLREKYLGDAAAMAAEEREAAETVADQVGLKEERSNPSKDPSRNRPSSNQDGVLHFGGDSKIEVETLGWEKMARKLARLDVLREVGLSGQAIAFATTSGRKATLYGGSSTVGKGRIKECCPRIEDLDLSRNLLNKWTDVAEICAELQNLKSLRLSNNRFQPLFPLPEGLDPYRLGGGFASVTTLALNSTFISWDDVLYIGKWCPSLEELHVGFNMYQNLSRNQTATVGDPKFATKDQPISIVQSLAKLRFLNLESNALTWNDIKTLRELPNLQTLLLQDNRLSMIDTPISPTDFPSLTTINISSNSIDSWLSVHRLNAYPKLTDIRIRRNPILDELTDLDLLAILVGRLAHVTRLNGTAIDSRERRDAEYFYISRMRKVREQVSTAEAEQAFAKAHPRYGELLAKWGEPSSTPVSSGASATNAVNATPAGSLGKRLVSVLLVSEDGKHDPIEKRFPTTMTVRALRALVARLFASKAGSTRRGPAKVEKLVLEYCGVDKRTVELNDDLRELDFYSMEGGERILVHFS
ncbi:hypothetical protein BJ742DRAFT_799563, partial [Cladochytrium replicatum]